MIDQAVEFFLFKFWNYLLPFIFLILFKGYFFLERLFSIFYQNWLLKLDILPHVLQQQRKKSLCFRARVAGWTWNFSFPKGDSAQRIYTIDCFLSIFGYVRFDGWDARGWCDLWDLSFSLIWNNLIFTSSLGLKDFSQMVVDFSKQAVNAFDYIGEFGLSWSLSWCLPTDVATPVCFQIFNDFQILLFLLLAFL